MSIVQIGFADDFESSRRVTVNVDGELPEHEQIWVWDVYFASVLYELSDPELVIDFKETIDAWAVKTSSKVFLPDWKIDDYDMRVIDETLKLEADSDEPLTDEVFNIGVEREEGTWPGIVTQAPDNETLDRKMASVVALAQYFINKNKLFFRELPIHVLAMRKYYIDDVSYDQVESINGAAVYALNKAMAYYEAQKKHVDAEGVIQELKAEGAAPVQFHPKKH